MRVCVCGEVQSFLGEDLINADCGLNLEILGATGGVSS